MPLSADALAPRRLLLAFLLCAWAAPSAWSACGTTATAAAGVTSIQAAVNSAPSTLVAGDHCVSVGAGTYNESVTIQNIDANNFRILIGSAPGAAVTVSPPAASTAAFVLRNASVTLAGLNVLGTNAMPYGVLASSAYIIVSSVNVNSGGKIYTAGISMSSWSAVSYSTINVQAAHGLYLNGSWSLVYRSSIASNNSDYNAVYFHGASLSTITLSYVWNFPGYVTYLKDSNYNMISFSTMAGGNGSANGGTIYLRDSSSNTMEHNYLQNYYADVVKFSANASYNTLSRSTLTLTGAGGQSALEFWGGTWNTVSSCFVSAVNGYGADFGSAFNSISQSTITTDAVGRNALQFFVGSSNTITQCHISNLSDTAVDFVNGSDYNTISQSTIVGSASFNLYPSGIRLSNASYNTITGSWIRDPVGYGLRLEIGAANNTISLSTITSGASGYPALYSENSSTNTITDSYIQGSTAAHINNSKGISIRSSGLIATSASGRGLHLSNGSINLSLSSSTVIGGNQAAGIFLDLNNAGSLSLTSNTVSGGKYGVQIASQTPSTTLFIASMTFRSLAAGATAIEFLASNLISTFSGVDFADANIAVNVNASLLGPSSRITLRDYVGSKGGAGYENDPFGLVEWPPPYPVPPGCGAVVNVAKDGLADATIIQTAVDTVPQALGATSCVVIRDTQTYSEQVTVRGFTNNGYRLKIMADPAFASSAPVVSPPALSTAAFLIDNASVTLAGINILGATAMPYGVRASSAYVALSSVNVDSAGKIYTAGVSLSSWGVFDRSSVTVQAAVGLRLDGTRNAISLSTITNSHLSSYAFHLNAASSNTVTRSLVSNPLGYAAYFSAGSDFNAVSASTFSNNDNGYGILLLSDDNTLVGNRIANFSVIGSRNVVSRSTLTSAGYEGIFVRGSSNTLANCYVQGASTGALLAGSTGTIISDSVLVAAVAAGKALSLLGPNANPGSGANINLFVASATLIGGSMGTGIALEEGNLGVLGIASSSVRAARYGLSVATQGAGSSLAIDSVTFSGLAAGATAIQFLGGTFVSTLSRVDFADAAIAVNVSASLLASDSRITMSNAAGSKVGPSFENDLFGLVDWANPVYARPFAAVHISSLTAAWFTSFPAGTLFYAQLSSGASFADAPISSSNTYNLWASFTGLKSGTIYYARVSTASAGPWTTVGSTATFEPASKVALPGTGGNTISMAWGDYDNDGDLDLAAANASSQDEFLLRNDGGSFTKVAISGSGGSSLGIAWGDYDNDGDLDLAVANASAQDEFLLRNDGGGSFAKVALAGSGGNSVGIAWGDYDNDGDLDLAVANGSGEDEVLLRNDGGGSFSKLTLTGSGGDSIGAAWGDYDRDGDLDLLISNQSSQDEVLYRNDGGGVLVKTVLTGTGASSVGASWGDFDGDGDLDLVFANYNGEDETFLFNDAGTFTQSTMTGTGEASYGAARGDFDGDGDLDAVVSNIGGQGHLLLLNEGGRTFTPIVLGSTASADGLSLGDYDDDGDLDVALGNSGTEDEFLLRNRFSAPLSTPAAPSSGFSSTFEEYGAWSSSGALTLRWGEGSDVRSSTAALDYFVRAGTAPGAGNLLRVPPRFSPDGFGGGQLYSTRLSPTQRGLRLPIQRGTTAYWAVVSVDGRGRRSAESAEQSLYTGPPISLSGCAALMNVAKTGAQYLGIQAAVDALAKTLAGDACVVIRDTQTYSEQVTLRGFANNGYTLRIMSDPSFTSSAPVVSPPALSTAAFLVMNASVAIQNVIVAAANSVPFGVLASSAHVSLSSITVDGGASVYAAGVALSSWSALAYSSVSAQNAVGAALTGTGNSVSRSTLSAASAGFPALAILGASSNTVADCRIDNPAWNAVYIASGTYNAIQNSTMTSSAAGAAALTVWRASWTALSRSYAFNPSDHGALLAYAYWSTVEGSTLGSADANFAGLFAWNSSSNTLQDSWLLNGAGSGGVFKDSHRNLLLRSSATNNGSAAYALKLEDSSFNSIVQSWVFNPGGYGALLLGASDRNTVTGSTLANAGVGYGLRINSADNTVFGSRIRNASIGGSRNLLLRSTMTSEDYEGLFINGASATVSNCYIQGVSTGALLAGATATLLSESVFVATNTWGTGLAVLGPSALYASGANLGVTVASSTLSGGPAGKGLLLDSYNMGTLSLATVTIRGSRLGLALSTQAAGASLSIASMTFESLPAGATAIGFFGGAFVSSFTNLTFSDAGLGVNIDASALSAGSRITVRVDTGPRTGPHYENDPGNYVEWTDFPRPGTPGNLLGTTLGASSIAWTWSATGGTEFYKVFQASSPSTLIATVAAAAFTMTGLSTNTAYGVTLKAANIVGEGSFSASATAYTFAAEPGTPSFDAVWTSSVAVSWAANGNPAGTGYIAQLSQAADFASLSGSSQTALPSAGFTGLSPKTTYYLRVRALNGDAVFTAFSLYSSTRTKPDLPAAPPAPAGAALGVSSIAWTWTTVADADAYKVFQASSPGTLIASSTGPAVVLTGLSTNTAYGIVLRAGNVVGYGEASPATTVYTLAAPPSAPAFEAIWISSLTASWTANGNPLGTLFLAQASLAADFGTVAGSSQTLNAFATIPGLSPKTTYYLRAAALSGASYLSAFSAASSTRTKPSLPLAPGTPAGAALGTSSIAWTWAAAEDAESYRVHPSSALSSLSGLTTAASFLAQGLPANSSHSIVSIGANVSGSGPASPAAAAVYTLANPPSGALASAVYASSATLAWTLNGNPVQTTAEAHRSTDNAVFSGVYSGQALGFTDYDLQGCTTYYYKVRNRNGSGIATAFGSVVQFKTQDSTPSAPSGLTAEPLEGSRIALAWFPSPSEGVRAYSLYMTSSPGSVYGASPTVLSSTVTSWTTAALASSGPYRFALRAANRCGVQETNTTVVASAYALDSLTGVRAAVKVPQSGKKVYGDRVTLVAELTLGSAAQTREVLFQYKASSETIWHDVAAANANHPNPDRYSPYFVHWDVTALSTGSYDLRAVASDGLLGADPSPSAVSILVDSADADLSETRLGVGIVQKVQKLANTVPNSIRVGDESKPQLSRVDIPSGALALATMTVTVVNNPAAKPPDPAGAVAVGAPLQIALSDGQTLLAGGKTAVVTLSYPDDDGDGVVDGTALRADRLTMVSAATAAGPWTKDLSVTLDRTRREVSGATSHFSFFAVFAAAAADLGAVRVYPVPFVPGDADADNGAPYAPGNPNSGILFDNLTDAVSIRIFTVSGQEVASFGSQNSGGKLQWDARNGRGKDAATGLYIAVITAPGQPTVTRKLLIVR